jgi:hypothetical protein
MFKFDKFDRMNIWIWLCFTLAALTFLSRIELFILVSVGLMFKVAKRALMSMFKFGVCLASLAIYSLTGMLVFAMLFIEIVLICAPRPSGGRGGWTRMTRI